MTVEPTHGIRLRRLRLHGSDRTYDVDFRSPDGSARPLSVIAGAFSTGKTTVLEFIDYCLGASDHPRHPEVMPKVRAATLEVDLSGVTHLIERSVGEPSTFAYVQKGPLDERGGRPVEKRPLRPAGHSESLSSLLLSHCKLEGVRLRERPAQADSQTDPLSFRDLMALCLLPNERVDGRYLLHEQHPVRNLKLRQVFDVVFDVHDDRAIELGRRIKDLDARMVADRAALVSVRQLVEEQRLGERATLERAHAKAEDDLTAAARELAAIDERARADTGFLDGLRKRYEDAAAEARRAADEARDCQAHLHQLLALRAQYADDIAALGLLVDAHRVFDPLRLTTCPACFSPLSWRPTVEDGRCTLCEHELPATQESPPDVSGELRAARARLAEITRYVDELERRLPDLLAIAERAGAAEVAAASGVDAAAGTAVTPYLAHRDALARRREAAAAARQEAAVGLRLILSVEQRAQEIGRHEATLATLREELAQAPAVQPDRSAVIARVSERYREILSGWRYPKLSDAYVADDLTPHVRGSSYTAASSGGRTLIALAWQLAIFEIAWESGSSHPGFLLLDGPHKNLGRDGDRDAEIAEAVTTAAMYRHLRRWLAGSGAGAQIIVADNAPPPEADADVVVRFSRRRDVPPYGLIDDETA